MRVPVVDKPKAAAAALFALAVFLPVYWLGGLVAAREISRAYALAWALFAGLAAFALSYTGRTAFWRRLFFGVSAAAFLLHFKAGLFTGAAPSCFEDTPYCHIAIAPAFLNYLYQQYLALLGPGWKLWGPLSLGAAWLFVTLALGRAWCSWACFYGGIDDSLAAVPKKPLLDITPFARRFRDLPAALLVLLLLLSFAYMLPVYCTWLCPFKFSGALFDSDPAARKIQYALTGLAAAALLLAPLLTAKRTFCSYLCPFAAWQAFFGRLNPFRVTADPAACGACGGCAPACPMSAITYDGEGRPALSAYCNLCGRCAEVCPGGVFRYTVFGLELPARYSAAGALLSVRHAYLFSALTLGGVFSSLWAPAALRDIVKYLGF